MMKQSKLRILILSVCALLIFGGTVKDVWAKYVKDTTLNGNITFQAELGDVLIREKQAVKQSNGTYMLNDVTLPDGTYNDNYTMMPGVDIPRNAWVAVVDKSSIPAYVYFNAVGGTPSGEGNRTITCTLAYGTVTYTLADHWKWVSDTKYIYAPGGTAAEVIANVDISVLSDNTMYVSHLASGHLSLGWLVSMEQVAP